ncbi:MAG TPA: nickel pincer cofactor biosynthesis protein LarC [Spirochaetota bacterium]|jgi:hypothetical protein|nr:nickel pincer cofactor biosynthesis protein LarC [Spirochaetota bacterium]OPZ36865.1 MAG: hypothetical protein BWY96_01982 [Spirochaetes bacterium ADurb.BinA120]HNU90548.1 nickel pincer cofactor biosynthesis protein LarC [Spirochaetota bacterium]HPI14027.1 nickel pincer cofactor biosynthesis protein LarC [Spirochaetota bacterium]HPO45952.1 nickel pincer cofactor biosynthesis protein LarC [Spirochaetota bacterium]
MSRTLAIDLQFGASGDMLLGALFDLGLDPGVLTKELSGLPLEGWSISPLKIKKYHLSGTAANVRCTETGGERHYRDIEALILGGGFRASAAKRAMRVFARLADAEAAVHGSTREDVHFHEVGAVDSIIDVAAFCAAIDILGVDAISFGDFFFGTGTVMSRHGELPVPVPAVVRLTEGYRCRLTGREGELVTPTAAAILTALGVQGPVIGASVLGKTGIGFGTRNHPFPSYTRIMLFGSEEGPEAEEVFQIECNIDDMNPQVYPHLIDVLLGNGALDAYLSAVNMKKGRPGTLLTVIVPRAALEAVRRAIYTETTTLGLRLREVSREKLERSFVTVHIDGREIRVKRGRFLGGEVTAQPEFEDCARVARESGEPLRRIMARALEEYYRKSGLE